MSFDLSDTHTGVVDSHNPKAFLGEPDLPSPGPFDTYDIHLAAFLMERGQKLVSSFLREGSVYFQFGAATLCKDFEREWRYEEPQVSIKQFLVHLNTCRDLLRVHKPPTRR